MKPRQGRQMYDSVITALDVLLTGTRIRRMVGDQRGGRAGGRRGGEEPVEATGCVAFSNWHLECWVLEPEEPSGRRSIWKNDRHH